MTNTPEKPSRFTIRVYGFLLSAENEILLSHEKIKDFAFTKFPGGGLEFGEGPADCVVRELKEECGLDVRSVKHVHTTEDFIKSKFAPEEQVIGIYYLLEAADGTDLKALKTGKVQAHDFRGQENTIYHTWVPLEDLKADMLTFDMDREAWAVFRKL